MSILGYEKSSQQLLDKAQLLDKNCGSALFVDSDYVYFAGGSKRNQLWQLHL